MKPSQLGGVLSVAAAALPACVSAATRSGGNSAARVPMSSLKTLYFKDGAKTMARRGKKMDALKCVGNSKHLCDTYSPDIVMCQNAGDGAWRCEADLHPSVRMGSIQVSCEGWEHPDDEYVMRGSCMLEYNILPAYAQPSGSSLPGISRASAAGNLFYLIFFAVLAYIVYSFFKAVGHNAAAPRGANRGGGGGFGGWGPGWGGGGGGGGGGRNDAPPPYQPYPKPGPSTEGTGWRPGFWTGMGLGGLAAGAARTLFEQPRREPAMAANWGAERRRAFLDDEDDEPMFRQTAAGPSRSSSSTGETRRSMGFGGTRNR